MEAERHWCTIPQLTQTADTRTDSISARYTPSVWYTNSARNTTSTWNTTRSTLCQWGSTKFSNQQFASRTCVFRNLLLLMVLDSCLRSESGSEPKAHQIFGTCHLYTETVNSGMSQWTAPKPSELRGLSVGCPVSLSIHSYHALAFAIR